MYEAALMENLNGSPWILLPPSRAFRKDKSLTSRVGLIVGEAAFSLSVQKTRDSAGVTGRHEATS